ncbi:hypothetical protein GCM10009765_39810 [Fodinicola feengrottensis]|uniref:Integral membrane protein n=1 Tax=Fodinicola feengrottensis TaxID=435914 RepID=A0ABN2HE07_9ACTN
MHGVAGTPPDELLDRVLVVRVAGDSRAGFYRPALADEGTDDAPGQPHGSGPLLEGYCWGGLTSGAAARAFWLLLLPFTIANVAPRLRPPSPPRTDGFLWWLSRLFALGLTALMIQTAAGVGVDQIGWRCGTLPAGTCPGLPNAVDQLLHMATPGQRLLLGAVVPIVVLLVLVLLGRGTAMRYEQADPDPAARYADHNPGDGPDLALSHPDLWRGQHLVRRLRRLHILIAVGICVVTVALPAYEHDRGAATQLLPLGGGLLSWLGWALLVLCAAAAVGVATLLAFPSVTSRRPSVGTAATLAERAYQAALALCLLAIGYVLAPRPGWSPTGPLPGFGRSAVLLFSLHVVILLVLAGTVALLWQRAARLPAGQPKQALGGYGTVLLTAASLLMAAGASAGIYLYVGGFLRTGSLRPSFGDVQGAVAALNTAPAIQTASLAFGLMLGWLVLVAFAGAGIIAYRLIWPTRWPEGQRLLNQQYPEAHRTPVRDAEILRAFWLARIADWAGGLIAAVLAPSLAIAAIATGFVLASAVSGNAASVLDVVLAATGSLSAIGAYGTVLGLLLLVAVGAAAFRISGTRRVVGVLWDVGAFWPRAAHPLAAPCYAERTVPDLLQRLRWYAAGAPTGGQPAGEATPVVVSGHSQGGVITAAVTLQLDSVVREQVAFLAIGTVLRRLYARYFPAYFGVPTLDAIAIRLTARSGRRLRNLWRTTDYVGGPIGSGPRESDPPVPPTSPLATADRRLTDPEYAAAPGDPVPPPIRAHSNYPADPVYHQELADLADLLPHQPPPHPERRLRVIH